MHTLYIPDRNKTYYMPSEMAELSVRQYLEFCKVIWRLDKGKISMKDAELALVIALADIKMTWKYAFMGAAKKEKIHLNLINLLPLVRTIFTEKLTESGEKALIPSISFVDNKIPSFDGLIGPDDALGNCTFFEYKEAYAQWYQYQETSDESYIDQLIAILYRPKRRCLRLIKHRKNFNGDSRDPYTVLSNPTVLERRMKKIAKWPPWVKYGIWLWFTACMEYLRTGKPVIDGIEIDLSILYKGEGGGAAGIGLTGVLYSLAETGVFGGIRETGDSNLYDVLARLYQVKLQMDELKEKSKSRQND
jgi:hypothetical protein